MGWASAKGVAASKHDGHMPVQPAQGRQSGCTGACGPVQRLMRQQQLVPESQPAGDAWEGTCWRAACQPGQRAGVHWDLRPNNLAGQDSEVRSSHATDHQIADKGVVLPGPGSTMGTCRRGIWETAASMLSPAKADLFSSSRCARRASL